MENLTKAYFIKNGFIETETNNFEISKTVNGNNFTLTVLFDGENWYFPNTKGGNHIYKTESDLVQLIKQIS